MTPFTVGEAKRNLERARASSAANLQDSREAIVAKWERVVATAERAALADEALALLEQSANTLDRIADQDGEIASQFEIDPWLIRARALLRRSGR